MIKKLVEEGLPHSEFARLLKEKDFFEALPFAMEFINLSPEKLAQRLGSKRSTLSYNLGQRNANPFTPISTLRTILIEEGLDKFGAAEVIKKHPVKKLLLSDDLYAFISGLLYDNGSNPHKAGVTNFLRQRGYPHAETIDKIIRSIKPNDIDEDRLLYLTEKEIEARGELKAPQADPIDAPKGLLSETVKTLVRYTEGKNPSWRDRASTAPSTTAPNHHKL